MYLIYFSAIVAHTMASNAADIHVAPETLESAPHSSPIPPQPTTAPKYDLARRQGSLQNTCGWADGNVAMTCPPNSYCNTDPAFLDVRCCGVDSLGSFTSCDTITSCADYSQYVTSCVSTTELCEFGVEYCGYTDYQYCWTGLIDLGSGSAFATWYQCAVTSSDLQQILQSTSDPVTTTLQLSTSSTITSTVQLPPLTVVTILPTTVVVTSVSVLSLPYPTTTSAADSSTSSLTTQSMSSSTTSSTVDSSTSSLTTGVAGISSGSTSSSSPNPPAQAASASASSTTGAVITSSSKSTSTGAIAGGTVGGVAVFAGIAGLAFLLLKKRRSSKPPITETSDINMPHTAFVAPAPRELHSPESSNRWSGGNSSEPQISESAAGPRKSYPYYAPGQQTRPFPQQEISQVNYPNTRTFSRHFNIEMPG